MYFFAPIIDVFSPFLNLSAVDRLILVSGVQHSDWTTLHDAVLSTSVAAMCRPHHRHSTSDHIPRAVPLFPHSWIP